MKWEIVLQAAGVVVAAVLGVSQLLVRLPKSRTTLKHDLEVLRLLPKAHPQRQLIEKQVQIRIDHVYGARPRFVVHQWPDLAIGALLLFAGVVWSLYLRGAGFSWWLVLSGLIAFMGLGGVFTAFEEPKSPKRP